MFDIVQKFEIEIAKFYNAPYAVATDCCTHAIELALRFEQSNQVSCPYHTYLSIPMTFEKLGLNWEFNDQKWSDYYFIGNSRIVDAAVHWKKDSYIKDTLFCLSFQFRKHLSLGRGGAILCSTQDEYEWLKKSSYDGRLPDAPWAEQDVNQLGYHYYMTPETAQLGLDKLQYAIETDPVKWTWEDYPNISKMRVFHEKSKRVGSTEKSNSRCCGSCNCS
jgi:dTDP-4-amino-4,6-dideoxygalactose transaminase